MSRNDFSRLFDQLEALTVGFGPVFRDFQTTTTNYPPHNIIRASDEAFGLELAVAGFKKNEVTMEMHEGMLTIKGTKEPIVDESAYQHKGIAGRSFSKSFRVAEYFEVVDAKLEDGILSVSFVKNVPESAKPKLIAIK
jgi:molecular chaperone IbpA